LSANQKSDFVKSLKETPTHETSNPTILEGQAHNLGLIESLIKKSKSRRRHYHYHHEDIKGHWSFLFVTCRFGVCE
jgi:hypothetical protein